MLAVTRVDRDGGIQNPSSQEFASFPLIFRPSGTQGIIGCQHFRYVVPKNSDQGS